MGKAAADREFKGLFDCILKCYKVREREREHLSGGCGSALVMLVQIECCGSGSKLHPIPVPVLFSNLVANMDPDPHN